MDREISLMLKLEEVLTSECKEFWDSENKAYCHSPVWGVVIQTDPKSGYSFSIPVCEKHYRDLENKGYY